MGTANSGSDCICRSHFWGVDMGTLGFEENLKRFSLFVVGCWWVYVGIQMIRYFIKGVL
jgi:hypothetical protein